MKTFCRKCGQVHVLTQEQFDAFELCHPCGNPKNLELMADDEPAERELTKEDDTEIGPGAFVIISGG